MRPDLLELLDYQTSKFNQTSFINSDPIQIPHQYSRKQDIEIMGFWTSILSWGQRKTIINKSLALANLMGESPYEFILNHQEKDRSRFLSFKHRTFQPTDTLYFLDFFQNYYRQHQSLEDAFALHIKPEDENVKSGLIGFEELFFSRPYFPRRTQKHISTPARNATCKRINMFLRWMVRSDEQGVDFGLWKKIKPSQLMIPLDVHVDRVARRLGLLKRKQRDWKAVEELTANLRLLDVDDPVKYDFALFGMGVLEKGNL